MPVLPSVAMRDGSYYEFWVYILTSRSGTLYVGVTGYLGTRIMQHKIDSIESFTKKYQVHRLVYYESYEYVQTAIRREKQLKGWRRAKKVALIEKINHAGRTWPKIGDAKCASGDSPSKRTP